MKQSPLNALSVIAYLVMVVGIVLLLFNQGLFTPSPVIIVLQAGAVLLMIWARVTFKGRSFHLSASPTEGGLVTSGPYHFIRHPIYCAVLLFAWPSAVGSYSVPNVLFALALSAGAMARILCEEHLVRVRYPEYDEYAKKTKRLIPFVF
jgi:protein-S-isoprenylcysteine O-methyltransferase Ste14